MNYQQVFQRFCELSRLSEKEAQQYKWLCNNAADELSEMLVSNIDKTKCGGRLSAAAAAMAYYRYIIIAENGGVTGFKAGDISVDCSKAREYAKEYLQQCLKGISGYISDGGFVFRGVLIDRKDDYRCY